MRKFLKVPEPKLFMISRAFKAINNYKTNEQKIFGYSEIMKKSKALMNISLARIDSVTLTEKKIKSERDTLALATKIATEVTSNKTILDSTPESSQLMKEFLESYSKYSKLLGK